MVCTLDEQRSLTTITDVSGNSAAYFGNNSKGCAGGSVSFSGSNCVPVWCHEPINAKIDYLSKGASSTSSAVFDPVAPRTYVQWGAATSGSYYQGQVGPCQGGLSG